MSYPRTKSIFDANPNLYPKLSDFVSVVDSLRKELADVEEVDEDNEEDPDYNPLLIASSTLQYKDLLMHLGYLAAESGLQLGEEEAQFYRGLKQDLMWALDEGECRGPDLVGDESMGVVDMALDHLDKLLGEDRRNNPTNRSALAEILEFLAALGSAKEPARALFEVSELDLFGYLAAVDAVAHGNDEELRSEVKEIAARLAALLEIAEAAQPKHVNVEVGRQLLASCERVA